MKKVVVPLSNAGIAELIKSVNEYNVWLKERSNEFLRRLAKMGYNAASAKFGTAIYDGTNDVVVKIEERDRNTMAIVATGTATLFIEFGTGVTYPNNHPQAGELGMARGEYGDGHGKQSSWGYYGEPGSNGIVREKPDGSTVVITQGNPANMPMYETVKELEASLTALAKEMFK